MTSLALEIAGSTVELAIANSKLVALAVSDSTLTLPPSAYDKKVDLVTDLEIYKGWAEPGSLTSDPVWRIVRYTVSDDTDQDVSVNHADGDNDFDNIWDDRSSLSYS